MAFANKIKGSEKLGCVISIEGNERTQAANAALKARRNELKAKPVAVKQAVIPSPWERELKRLGFEV
jgi:hypothetical protein